MDSLGHSHLHSGTHMSLNMERGEATSFSYPEKRQDFVVYKCCSQPSKDTFYDVIFAKEARPPKPSILSL